MVTTRSMAGTSKKTDTRLAVKVTRSMAGTSKKTDTKLAEKDKQKAAKIASNKAMSGKPKKGTSRRMTVMDEAYVLFIGHYKDEHFKKYPPLPTQRVISKELILAIQKKWTDMSDKDKAPFKKRAKENRANGCVQL
ncbi:hypothetical protein POM88_027651 [Heracleum sosnowskyi]|uniref:HMG box domain-containing protein n=1 Tax=Heracleum sosnowskyi TaxID=360622 RepID=A0AAD8IAD8_9APIA|nr:hypothetical protein POM88_027651 [Heracleum sosnowskyi]